MWAQSSGFERALACLQRYWKVLQTKVLIRTRCSYAVDVAQAGQGEKLQSQAAILPLFEISGISSALRSTMVQAVLWLCCRLAREKGFKFKQDGEHGFRRVVASPEPKRILEASAIQVSLRQIAFTATLYCMQGLPCPQMIISCAILQKTANSRFLCRVSSHTSACLW